MTFPKDTGEFMQTYSGVAFNLRQPTPEMVRLEDLAHHLATLNRFTGALSVPRSIAQHAVLVSFLVPERLALFALHHDDHEAYVNDMSSPVKRTLRAAGERHFDALGARIQWAIEEHFNIREIGAFASNVEAVKRADLIALRLEADHGFAHPPQWIVDYPEPTAEERERVPIWLIEPLDNWRSAASMYLARHHDLMLEQEGSRP